MSDETKAQRLERLLTESRQAIERCELMIKHAHERNDQENLELLELQLVSLQIQYEEIASQVERGN